MIREKLNILKESEVIDDEAYDYSLNAIDYLLEQGVIDDEDEPEVVITHLAMATARQGTDQDINTIDENILNEIKNDDQYEEAVRIWDELKKIAPTTFPESEDEYFHLHFVTLLKKD